MKTVFHISIVLITVALTLSAQNSDDSTENAKTDFETFVDNIVNHVEREVEAVIERQRTRENISVEFDDEHKDKKSKNEAVTFNGDTEVAEHDTINGDIVVKNGTLTIRGIVIGDAVVFNGTLNIRNTGIVKGNARAINGTVVKDEKAIVEGYTEESETQAKERKKKTQRTKYSYSFKPQTWWWEEEMLDENTLLRYNRVEGLFIGVGSEKKFYWDQSRLVSGYGSVGYGFSMHKWRLQLGLDRQFVSSDALYEIGMEAHSLTDSKEDWIMPSGENSLAAFFFREDYRDYFQREGFSLHTARYTRENYTTLLDVRYGYDRYNSLDKNADWALFGGSNIFRANPGINVGIMRNVKISAGLSTVEKYRRMSEGWNLFSSAEYAGDAVKGNFNFTHVVVDIRRYQPLSTVDELSARLRVGSLEGDTIAQRTFEIGGANTLPGYSFKEFSGNRMILANLEYQNTDLFDDVFFWPSSFRFIVFGDIGAATFVPPKKAVYEGFNDFRGSQIKSDIGFAIGLFGGDSRLGFAWRNDISAPVSVFLRINKTF